MNRRRWIVSAILLASVVAIAAGLAIWKAASIAEANAASRSQPEPMESVRVAVASEREYRPTTTAIGTVIALRSITLRNEVPGTVRHVHLAPGQIVEAGTVLVALDVSVEQAELNAQQAQAALAEVRLGRVQRMSEHHAISDMELDTARAECDVALAQVARIRAVIARKMIRAPFRARVGISDVHPGQYLVEGTELTTLQGVDASAYVDFPVAQHVAAVLGRNAQVDIFTGESPLPTAATVVAIDARFDPTTRNGIVRARIDDAANAPAPGASVRVGVPVGSVRKAVTIPVSALRKGPGGDHVFVVEPDNQGKQRAHVRQVVAGVMLGDEIVVEKGLSAGERVAASGSFKLREAVLVAIADDAAAGATSGG